MSVSRQPTIRAIQRQRSPLLRVLVYSHLHQAITLHRAADTTTQPVPCRHCYYCIPGTYQYEVSGNGLRPVISLAARYHSYHSLLPKGVLPAVVGDAPIVSNPRVDTQGMTKKEQTKTVVSGCTPESTCMSYEYRFSFRWSSSKPFAFRAVYIDFKSSTARGSFVFFREPHDETSSDFTLREATRPIPSLGEPSLFD